MDQPILNHIAQNRLNVYRIAFMDDSGVRVYAPVPANACNDWYSVAKTFVVTALGILQDRGLVSVSGRVFPLFSGAFPKGYDRAWEHVTVAHALLHRIGFDRGFLDIDTEDVHAYGTDDYLSLVLAHPLAYAPGTHMQYSDAAYYLLSRLVETVSGQPLDEFLRETVLRPLDIGETAWSRCPRGHTIGATGLYMRAEDVVKLGWTYLNGGVYGGKRIFSEAWAAETLSAGYEFRPVRGAETLLGKPGMNGQMLLFSPERRIAAAYQGYAPGGQPGLNACIERAFLTE